MIGVGISNFLFCAIVINGILSQSATIMDGYICTFNGVKTPASVYGILMEKRVIKRGFRKRSYRCLILNNINSNETGDYLSQNEVTEDVLSSYLANHIYYKEFSNPAIHIVRINETSTYDMRTKSFEIFNRSFQDDDYMTLLKIKNFDILVPTVEQRTGYFVYKQIGTNKSLCCAITTRRHSQDVQRNKRSLGFKT